MKAFVGCPPATQITHHEGFQTDCLEIDSDEGLKPLVKEVAGEAVEGVLASVEGTSVAVGLCVWTLGFIAVGRTLGADTEWRCDFQRA